MEGSFLLPALVLVPLIGAIITLFMGGKRQKYAKYTAFVTTLVILAIAVVLLLADDLSAYDFSANWIDTAGVKMNLIFRVDGLSILMVFLTSVLVPLALVFSYKEGDRPNYFYALLLAIEFGLLGVYTSADYFLFYIMWEVTLIPFYFLISWYGGPRRHYAAIKFFIYTHV
ncbi:MAG: proton-conducting transporter membrane subunit, partial [Methanomethylophilus sp.]